MAIQQAERAEWVHHPVTQEFLAMLRESKQETLEHWGREAYTAETGESTLLANAKALGGVHVLNQVIDAIEVMGEEE